MKVLIFLILFISIESFAGHLFSFGDRVKVVAGFYKGSTAAIISRIPDDRKDPCKIHQYYTYLSRDGMNTKDYICEEDMETKK